MADYFNPMFPRNGLELYPRTPFGNSQLWINTALDSLVGNDSFNVGMADAEANSAYNDFYDQSDPSKPYYGKDDPAYQPTPKTQPLPAVQRGPQPMPKRVNQYGDDYINSTRPTTMQSEGERLASMIANDDPALSPDVPLDAAGARQIQLAKQAEAQKAFMAMQGIQGKQDNRSTQATERLLANPGMQFGKGGGDWASAWSKAMQPQRGIFDSIVGNQVGSFLDYGKGLNQTFNSATGPYGQMQAAAVATAPSRAQRAISKDKLGMLSGLFDQMSANKTPSVSSVETDYGAYAKMLPSLMKKYLPGG